MKERAKRFLTSIVAALTLVGSVPTQAYASELEPDSSLISPQDNGTTPDAGNAPAVESSTPASDGTTGDNATTTDTTVTDTTTNDTTVTDTTVTDTTTTNTTTTDTTVTDTTTNDTTVTDTTVTDTTTTNTTTTNTTTTGTTTTGTTTNATTTGTTTDTTNTTTDTTTDTTTNNTTTTETPTNSTATDDSTDIGENDQGEDELDEDDLDEDDLGEDELDENDLDEADLDDLDLEDMADALVLSFEASTFSLRTTAAQEPTLLAEVENQTTTPVVKIGETTLGDAATDAGWSGGSGWRYDGTSVSMVNNGNAVNVHADGTGIDFNMAGVNHIGTLYADGDVNITGTGILLIDAIDMLEGKSLNLLTNTGRYEDGTGSVAVFLRNAETGKYELINGNVKGILDEEYTIPDGIELVVPDGGTLDMRITTQVTTTTNGESETHYGLTNKDYGLLDADVTSGENSYTKEVKEGENLVSRVLGITVPKLTISSGASLLLKGNAKLLMEAFEETVLTHAHHSSTLEVNGALTLADNAALELTNHASDINTHTGSSQFSVVMNAGGSVTGSGTMSGAAVTYNGGSGTINFTGNNSYVDVQCTQNPDMTFTTTGNTDVFYSDGKTLKALEAKNGGSFSLYAKAADKTATTNIDGFSSRLNITDSVSGSYNVKSGYVSLNGNLINEELTVSGYDPLKFYVLSLTNLNKSISKKYNHGIYYFSSGATNTYKDLTWTEIKLEGPDTVDSDRYAYRILNANLDYRIQMNDVFVSDTDLRLFEVYMYDSSANETTVSLIVKSPTNSDPICIGEAVDPAKVFLVRCIAGTVTAEAPFTGSIVNPGTSNTGSGILGGSNAGSLTGGNANSVLGGNRQPPKPVTPPTEPKPTEPVTPPTEPKPTEPVTPPTEPKPTEPVTPPTEPKPTEPKPTEPKPTEPKPTEPKPTEPKPTEPKPTEAGYSANISVGNSVTAGSNQDLTVQVLQDSTDFRVTAYADGVELKNLEGSTIPVTMEVSLEEGWNRNDLFVVFRGENGKLVAVKARYNPATGMLMFDAPMLGKFRLVSFPWDGTDYESEAFLAALNDYMN